MTYFLSPGKSMKKIFLSTINSKTFRDLLGVLSGNIVSQGLSFLAIVIISRELGPKNYGIFSFLLTFFTISVQIADFGISTSYIKYVSENKERAKEIFLTIFFSKIFLSFVVISLFFLSSSKISEFFFESDKYINSLKMVSIAILFHALYSLFTAHFQAIQNFRLFSLANIFHNLLKLLSIVWVTFYFSAEYHLKYFLFAYTFSVTGILLFFFIKNYDLFLPLKSISLKYLWEIYRMGFWVFLSSIATMIIMRLDIIMLKKMSPVDEVGYYTAAMNLAMIFPLITASLVTTLLPKMYDFLKNNSVETYVYRILRKTKLVLSVLILLELFSPLLIRWVFGNAYISSIPVFQILLVAFTFGVIINPISLVMYAINKAWLLTLMNWIQLPLNFLGNLIMIPLYDSSGAAISTVILRLFAGLYVTIYLLKVRKCSTD